MLIDQGQSAHSSASAVESISQSGKGGYLSLRAFRRARSCSIACHTFASLSHALPRHPFMFNFSSDTSPPSDANLASVKLGHNSSSRKLLICSSLPSSTNFSSLRNGSPRNSSRFSFLNFRSSRIDSMDIRLPG